jgi:hypothetical protein
LGAEVPFGTTLQRWFGAQPNMYDRLVHLCFGLLVPCPVREVFHPHLAGPGLLESLPARRAHLAFSAIFEIIEWIAAVTSGRLSPAGRRLAPFGKATHSGHPLGPAAYGSGPSDLSMEDDHQDTPDQEDR